MAEYIEREEAIKEVLSCFGVKDSIFSDATIIAIGFKLKDIPAADVQPVVHGRWKWSEGGQCSECGFHNSNFGYNYCPNCGARMDGET